MKQKQSLDKAALQEEGAAWARQEDRDIVQLNRMQSGMEAEREAAMQQQAAGDQALMSGLGATGSALSEVDFTGQP